MEVRQIMSTMSRVNDVPQMSPKMTLQMTLQLSFPWRICDVFNHFVRFSVTLCASDEQDEVLVIAMSLREYFDCNELDKDSVISKMETTANNS